MFKPEPPGLSRWCWIAFLAGISLALSFTFSCSSVGGGGGDGSSSSVADGSSSSNKGGSSSPSGGGSSSSATASGGGGSSSSATSSGGSSSSVGGGGGLTGTSGTITDSRDNKPYKLVKIDEQYWLAENLNYDVPNNDDDVCYDNNPANCTKYGRLYDWATAMALPSKCNSTLSTSDADCAITTPYHKGICPTGWHIPSNADWNVLMKFVNPSCSDNSSCATAGTKLKATSGWNSGGNGQDTYGFSALPGGYGNSDGYFFGVGDGGEWWGASEVGSDVAYERFMYYSIEYVSYNVIDKDRLFSVRCVQD